MSQPYYLVCHETRRFVHVAESGGFGFRCADDSTAVGSFCQGHYGKALCVLGPEGLEEVEIRLPQGESYTEWTHPSAPTNSLDGTHMSEDRRIGRFFLRQELFEQVKEHMAIELEKVVSDEEAEAFLARHPPLLGSIVGYDEVDTEDRSRIWEFCRRDKF